jgi:hypothetical protein
LLLASDHVHLGSSWGMHSLSSTVRHCREIVELPNWSSGLFSLAWSVVAFTEGQEPPYFDGLEYFMAMNIIFPSLCCCHARFGQSMWKEREPGGRSIILPTIRLASLHLLVMTPLSGRSRLKSLSFTTHANFHDSGFRVQSPC